MGVEFWNAALPVLGTMVASFAGILVSNRLTLYRVEQLEKKVDKHNNLVERMVKVEESTKSAHHRLNELKGED